MQQSTISTKHSWTQRFQTLALSLPNFHAFKKVCLMDCFIVLGVQVVIGSFLADVKKGHKQAMPSGAPYPGVSTPTSRGTPSGSSGGPGSPLNQSASGSFNTSNQQALADFPWRWAWWFWWSFSLQLKSLVVLMRGLGFVAIGPQEVNIIWWFRLSLRLLDRLLSLKFRCWKCQLLV